MSRHSLKGNMAIVITQKPVMKNHLHPGIAVPLLQPVKIGNSPQ